MKLTSLTVASISLALLAGCAFHAHAAGGDDGSGGPTALIDDTAADFQQGSSFSYEGVIDPLGTLQPQAGSRSRPRSLQPFCAARRTSSCPRTGAAGTR